MTIQKILNTKWLIILIIMDSFRPAYLDQIPFLDLFMDGIRITSAAIILILYFISIKVHIRKSFNILMYILTIELLLATLIGSNASIHAWIMQMVYTLILCLFIEELMVYAPYNGLKCLYAYFSLITMINTATIFIFPNAMYPNNRGRWVCWFLGEDNTAYIYYVLASTFAMLYCQYVSKKVTSVALLTWLSAFVFVFHNGIATGIVCQLIWLLLVAGYQFNWFKRLLKAQYALYIMLAGFFALVVSRKMILTFVIEALGRDITLSGRTIIWDRTMELISKNPVFGYGVCEGTVFADMARLGVVSSMPHDWILFLCFSGGIVATLIHVVQVYCACREAWPFRFSPYYRCLVIGFIIVYIRAVTEGSTWLPYFLLPAMICYSKEFLNGIAKYSQLKRQTRKAPYTIPKIKFTWRRQL